MIKDKTLIVLFMLVCSVLSVHANTDIEQLYAKIVRKPDAKIATELIKKLYEQGQADSAFVFKRNDDTRLMKYVSISMSYYYFDNGKYDKSIEMNEQALKYADQADVSFIIDNYLQMSSSYTYLSNYQAAINVNMKAISLADKSKDAEQLSIAYNNMANAYLSLLKVDHAWKFNKTAIEIEKKRPNPENLTVYYGLAAEILRKKNKNKEALRYIKIAIELSEKMGNGIQTASHYTQATDIYITEQKWKEAEKESLKALIYFDNNDPTLETIICFKQYGQIQGKLNKRDEAIKYLTKAEQLCIRMNNLHQLLAIYEILSEIEEKYDPALSLKYLKKRDQLKDSIFTNETNRIVSEAEVKYEVAKKELTIQQQESTLKTRRIWMISGSAAAVVIIMLIIVYVSISNSRKNKRHAAQLKVERDEATKARDEATKARDAAERANALKGVFIDNVVHELRTPINAIQGFSQLLDPSFGSSPEETQEYLGIINDNCNNLITLVQDTIDVSEMENESYPVHPAEVRIETVCKDAADKEQHRLQDKEVKIHVRETGDFCVTTDKSLLTRLLQNLISNACKYTSKGSISIEFHRGLWSERQEFNLEEMLQRVRSLEEESGPAKPWNLDNNDDEDISTEAIWAEAISEEEAESQAASAFSITVTDTGCGIAPENAEKIFNRFEKLGSYIPGNGMGLTIVRLIAHLLQGEAYLDTSYEGKGCRFIAEMRCF